MSPGTGGVVGDLIRNGVETVDAAPRAVAAAGPRLLADAVVCAASARPATAPADDHPYWRASRLAVRMHERDRDDLHWPSLTHPGGVIWPVVIVEATDRDVELATLYRAAAVGYEVGTRSALTLGSAHRRTFHATATAGTVGAAVAASLLRHGDVDAAIRAGGHAASVIGGTAQAVRERSATALFHRAHAAVTGLHAARSAYLSPAVSRPFEGDAGFAVATGAELAPPSSSAPAVSEVTLRRHPATGFSHAMIDAIRDAQHGRRAAGRIVEVTVELPALAVDATLDGDPRSASEAWWNIPYLAAVELVEGLAEPGPTWPPSTDVARVARLVRIERRDTRRHDDLRVRVRIRRDDGSDRSAVREVPRGHPRDPVDDEGFAEKATQLSGVPPSVSRALLEALRDPGRRLSELLRGEPAVSALFGAAEG